MIHRTEIARHFVDSSTLFVSVSELPEGGGVLKLRIECNRTAASRMVLTDRQYITAEDEVQNNAETLTGGSCVQFQSAADGFCCLIVKR